MLTITMKIPRQQNKYIHYTGDAEKFVNMPIVVNEKPIGIINKIISNTDDYIEVEGCLWRAGVDYIDGSDGLVPADITILNEKEVL
jgi:hypothetical protein